MPRFMTISQLADAAGVGIETIRYYQRRGLLTVPAKPRVGRRQYGEPVVRQIGFIRQAQLLGFTLEEIGTLSSLGSSRCGKVQLLAQAKLDELGRRVVELNRMRSRLRALIKQCEANPRGQACPMIAALQGDGR